MKKIPTLFEREFKDHNVVKVLPKVHPGMEWVIEGKGTATVKWDGSCCMIANGNLFKRYDANIKKGQKVPDDAIPCQDKPDPVTGHFPCWVKIDLGNPKPEDKWFVKAYFKFIEDNEIRATTLDGTEHIAHPTINGTYEAVGKHFNGNPYSFGIDTLIPHGKLEISVLRTYDGIREYLKNHNMEGIVFWKGGSPQCKIKRSDFGFEWPVKGERESL